MGLSESKRADCLTLEAPTTLIIKGAALAPCPSFLNLLCWLGECKAAERFPQCSWKLSDVGIQTCPFTIVPGWIGTLKCGVHIFLEKVLFVFPSLMSSFVVKLKNF